MGRTVGILLLAAVSVVHVAVQSGCSSAPEQEIATPVLNEACGVRPVPPSRVIPGAEPAAPVTIENAKADADQLRALLDGSVRDGYITAAERDDLLAQRKMFEARRAELRAAHPEECIGLAKGELVAATDFRELFASLHSRNDIRPAYVELAPGSRFYSTPRNVGSAGVGNDRPRLTRFLSEEEESKLHDQRDAFNKRREALAKEHPNQAVAIVDGEVFACETTSELMDAIEPKVAGAVTYCEDPVIADGSTPNWFLLHPGSECGDSIDYPGFGAASIAELSGDLSGGGKITRIWTTCVSTATQMTAISRQILRKMKPRLLGVIARGTASEEEQPDLIGLVCDGIRVTICLDDDTEASWDGPFLLSGGDYAYDVIGEDVLRQAIKKPFWIAPPSREHKLIHIFSEEEYERLRQATDTEQIAPPDDEKK